MDLVISYLNARMYLKTLLAAMESFTCNTGVEFDQYKILLRGTGTNEKLLKKILLKYSCLEEDRNEKNSLHRYKLTQQKIKKAWLAQRPWHRRKPSFISAP